MNDKRFRNEPRSDWMKEHKTPEEKAKSLKDALQLLEKLTLKGVQGNVSFPLYEGGIGKARVEIYIEPSKATTVFNYDLASSSGTFPEEG